MQPDVWSYMTSWKEDLLQDVEKKYDLTANKK